MRNVVRTSFMFTKFKLLKIFLSFVLNIILLCDTCIYGTCLPLKPSVSSRDKLNRLTTFFFGSYVYIKGSYCSLSKATCNGCKFAQATEVRSFIEFFRFWCLFLSKSFL